MISYTVERVESLLKEAERAVEHAEKHGLKYVEQSPIVVRNVLEDLVEAHKRLIEHSCKSKFIPGVIVGVAGTIAVGAYFNHKDKKKLAK